MSELGLFFWVVGIDGASVREGDHNRALQAGLITWTVPPPVTNKSCFLLLTCQDLMDAWPVPSGPCLCQLWEEVQVGQSTGQVAPISRSCTLKPQMPGAIMGSQCIFQHTD